MKPRRKLASRVFSHLINKAAFIDKIVLSVNGELNETFIQRLEEDLSNTGIFRPGSLYGRLVISKWPLTGNPVKIYYGKTVRFRNVPKLRFIMRSEEIPLTGSQTQLLIKWLTVKQPEITVSSLEMTFDVSGTSIEYILQHLIHRVYRVTLLQDERGFRTVYVGSPRSAWEARIYRKTKSVVRFEFILRRRFLSAYSINRPEDVLLLQRFNIWRLLSLRRFSRKRAALVTRDWKNSVARDLVVDWQKWERPMDSLVTVLRINRINPTDVFRRTTLQRTLESMQHRFLW